MTILGVQLPRLRLSRMVFLVDRSAHTQPVKMCVRLLYFYRIFLLIIIFPVVIRAQEDPGEYAIQPLASSKLNVSIYYEGLCPDSRIFITETFPPAYTIFADYLNVRFIPFGKASIREDGSDFQCQHGKEECIRNIIHGCALDVLPPGIQQFEFVYCAMINKSLQGQKSCVQANGLSWEDIQNCVNGERGLQLILQAQYDTRKSTGGPKFVPTIIFNDLFLQEDQDIGFTNPTAVICKYLVDHPQCIIQQQNTALF